MYDCSAFLRSQFGKPSGLFGSLVMAPVLNLANMPLVNRPVDLLGPGVNDVVLDIGFGGGYSLLLLAHKVPQGKVVGIDYSAQMVDQAANLLRRTHLDSRVHVQCADVARLPFADGIFDRVLTVNSVYYWPDIVAGFREIVRGMKRHGRLAVGFRSRTTLRPKICYAEGMTSYLYERKIRIFDLSGQSLPIIRAG